MMDNFDIAFEKLIGHEGGYSNNPNDPGGETNWGVTLKVARDNGYHGAMKDMTRDIAKIIYKRCYWLPAFDTFDQRVAFQVFDAAVNSGVGQSVRWLQRCVGAADDGKLGPITAKLVSEADPVKLVAMFNAERLLFMTNLSTWNSFGRGWARRIAANLKMGV